MPTMSNRRHFPRLSAARREEERVTPLELFFDLAFVLAVTQCTALIAGDPTTTGLLRGIAVLAVLWWTWVGYAWLTSVVDPDEGAVRLVIFAAMAGLVIAAIAAPEAFDELAVLFAVAYGAVRAAHIALFMLASRDDPLLRHSVLGLALSTAIGVGLLVSAAFLDDGWRAAAWLLAIAVDVGGPYFFGAAGWRLAPAHFAERHGLIVIIALGESIVAVGVGLGEDVTTGVVVAAILGVALAAALWWAYFDVVALVAGRQLAAMREGREQNELARDAYSYLHFPMVAGIVLVALGLEKTMDHVDAPLDWVPAIALVGGLAVYLLGHVAFRWRTVHVVKRSRLLVAVVLGALVPLAHEVDALVTLALVTALVWALLVYEMVRYAEDRDHIRHQER
jgi:low temperature requirement protein LtrA